MTPDTPRFLNCHITSDDPNVQLAVNHFLELMDVSLRHSGKRTRAPTPNTIQSHQTSLEVLLLNVYGAYKQGANQWVPYSRSKAVKNTRYTRTYLTIGSLNAMTDFMTTEGYLEHLNGSYDRTTGRGKLSRLRATPKLIKTLDDDFKFTHTSTKTHPETEAIKLKNTATCYGGTKPLIEYTDTPQTKAMRDEMTIINEALEGCSFGHDIPPSLSLSEKDIHFIDAVKFTPNHLYRTFNNSSFDHGGRLYGGWWLNGSKKLRPFITIDGEKTVELDFGQLHPTMLYHKVGLQVHSEFDPYMPQGYLPEQRDGFKVLLNKMLNLKCRSRAKIDNSEGSKEPLLLQSGKTYKDAIEALYQHNKPISHFFYTGMGLKLQRKDSDMAVDILTSLLSEDIVALPVHDSFIVKRSHEKALRRTMVNVYKKHFTFLPLIKSNGIIEVPLKWVA